MSTLIKRRDVCGLMLKKKEEENQEKRKCSRFYLTCKSEDQKQQMKNVSNSSEKGNLNYMYRS